MRRRSTAVSLGLTALVAATLAGCGAGDPVTTSTEAVTSVASPDSAPETLSDTPPGDAPVDAASDDGEDSQDAVDDGSGDVTDSTDGVTDGSDTAEYTAVCVDQTGEQRVDDAQCAAVDPQRQHVGGGHHGLGTALVAWYFLRAGSSYPAVGSRVVGGSYTPPASSYRVGGLPATKGTVRAATSSSVSKGGFGGSHRSGSIGG